MRSLLACLPILFITAACSSANWAEDESNQTSNLSKDGDDEGSSSSLAGSGSGTSVAYGPCRASRATILASVSAARASVMRRGFEWLDDNVPFSMSGRHEGYRTDCSGFVSMCHELGAPGKTTRDLGNSGSGMYKLDSYEDLVPADALVDPGHHSFIFLGWNDSAHSGMCVLEQASTKSDMQFRVRLAGSLKSDGFIAVRADDLRNDTKVNNATANDSSNNDSSNKGTTTQAEDKCNTSVSVTSICNSARTTSGVECGRIKDDCGRVVDCSVLTAYTCAANSACVDNKCAKCQPRSAETLCQEARSKLGVECGEISDGCGGKISCDSVPGFGCSDGKKCGAYNTNKCSATASSGDPDNTKPSSTTSNAGDEGDQGDDPDVSESDRSAKKSGDDGESTFQKRKPVSSGGCSAAPEGKSSNALAPVGLLLSLALMGRRRRGVSR